MKPWSDEVKLNETEDFFLTQEKNLKVQELKKN